MLDHLKNYNIILASQSPRRQFLLKELGVQFEVRPTHAEEDYSSDLKREEIPLYLCKHKAESFANIKENDLVITADTIVWVENKVLNKPADKNEAIQMLNFLSGKMHEVITAVCLKSLKKTKVFFAVTKVFFKDLSNEEIEFYIKNFKPFDKAGSYGAQEWLGYTSIEKIEGSYFNVMGLPTKDLYEELSNF